MPLTLHTPGSKSKSPKGRREELLQQVGAWIGRVGVVGFSLRAAANAVGVSAPTLLRHFGSKDGLLAELAALNDRNDVQILRSSIADAGSLSAALRKAATRPIVIAPEHVRLALQLAALKNSEAHQRDHKAKATMFVRVLVAAMVEEGISPREATSMAHYMSASSVGFLNNHAVFQDLPQLQRNYRHLYTYVADWMQKSASSLKRAASF